VAAKWANPEHVCRGEPVGLSQAALLDTPKKQGTAWQLRGDKRPNSQRPDNPLPQRGGTSVASPNTSGAVTQFDFFIASCFRYTRLGISCIATRPICARVSMA